MGPWTQRIILQWEPELRYYETRTTILRALHDRGDLHAFHVSDVEVRGRLLADQCELVIARDRLEASIWGPDVDASKVWDAVTLAVAMLEPAKPLMYQVLLQHVLPLSVDFATAVGLGYRRLFAPPVVEGVRFDDWAFLSDLVITDEPSLRASVEYGIVRPDELLDRLTRRVGRVRRVMGATPGFVPEFDENAFPPASLFADSWWASPAGQVPLIQAALQFWYTSLERAQRVVESIQLALSRDDERGRRTA